MSGRIPRAFIDELIARTDIVELIGARVPLKRAGREYKACCPFHDEKTASFWVSPDKQFYHCFGCGAHGTALGFLMEFDRLAFPEAVEELATRHGLTVPHEGPTSSIGTQRSGTEDASGPPGNAESTTQLYGLLAEAADFFRSAFAGSESARAYAARRGLNSEYLERFGIGYAPDSWNELLRRLGSSERAVRDLLAVGLIIERDGAARDAAAGSAQGAGSLDPAASTPSAAALRARCYDRFRDRLMFPIRDTRGRVIGFGGRVLDVGEPKYLNSPETVLFHKGRELYGLYETRLSRQPLRRLIVVEGYMDAVRLHQAGLPYAVATLGTATTAEHLRRAFRLVSEIVFAFDGDRAGRAAAWRALQNALPEVKAGREIRFLFLPDGEDPDSLVGREGATAFEARIAAAVPMSEYLIAHLCEQTDVKHADGKARFMALLQPLWERLAPGIYRELLLERIAEALQLPADRLQQWLGQRTPTALTTPATPSSDASAERRKRRQHPSGRGTLITQAITLLLHFPLAAAAVGSEQRSALSRLAQPGVAVLAELLEQQSTQPASNMAQILERWRERPEHRRLAELAAAAPLIEDSAAAGLELAWAVDRLLDRELRHGRLEALIEKARTERLEDAEKLELQALTQDQSGTQSAARRGGQRT
jgi:DNA primase